LPKKTVNVLKETNNEGVLQVKNNQPTLLADCERISKEQKPDNSFSSKDTKRGRVENRHVSVFHIVAPNFADTFWNTFLKSVVTVERACTRFDVSAKKMIESKEISYYVSTTILNAKKANTIIRGHWGIENRNHYVKDVSMNEDKSRIRKNPQNMARLRSFSLNLMRINGSGNIGRDLFRNALNLERVLEYRTVGR
jgi:predicted transposase YbfD/YdcC